MAIDNLEVERLTGTAPARPGSVVDRLLGLVDLLPGPSSLWFVVLALTLLAPAHAWIWATGARPVGQVELVLFAPTFVLAYFLWLLHLLNRVASSAFDAFRPALGGPAGEQEHYRLALTSIPDRVAVVAVVVTELILGFGYFGMDTSLRLPLPVAVDVATGILYALVAPVIGLLIVHDIRQLRLVSRLSALATNVDIFKPGPVTAFSRLTAATAIGLLAFVALMVLTIPVEVAVAGPAVLPGAIGSATAMGVLAVASFVLPLRVMHGRLLAQKLDLLDSAQDRLKVILGRISDAVDANELSNADELNKTLSSVLAQRDVLARLPTWPWSSGTFRGVASAVLLPIAIFVITRLIDQLL
jgi:hypothetical protein